jgi:AcrR family transcriptional regulator
MKTTNKYHRANLRSELLQTAVKIISTEGLEKLTIRELSRQVGVSRTALYRHFADKKALMCAVAQDGFRKLTSRYRIINRDTSLDASNRFRRIGRAYVEFAIKNPGYYRLMFGHEIIRQERSPELIEAARETYDEFLRAVRTVQEDKNIKPDDPVSLANIAWTLVHGLASLLIDGQIQTIDESFGLPTLLDDDRTQWVHPVHQSIRFSEKALADFWTMISHSSVFK